MEDVNDIEVVLNEAFVLIMLVKWETQANAQTQTGVRLLMMSVFVLIVSLLWFMAVSITCTCVRTWAENPQKKAYQKWHRVKAKFL